MELVTVATGTNGCCRTTPPPAPLPLCATPPAALRHRPHCARPLRLGPFPLYLLGARPSAWTMHDASALVCGQYASCTPLVAFHAAPDPSPGPALTPASLSVISSGPCVPCRIPHNDIPGPPLPALPHSSQATHSRHNRAASRQSQASNMQIEKCPHL